MPLLMPMLIDFFDNGILPESMKTAITSLLHKKDKDVADCTSFLPISLLPVNFKITSMLIEHRLKDLLLRSLILTNPASSKNAMHLIICKRY